MIKKIIKRKSIIIIILFTIFLLYFQIVFVLADDSIFCNKNNISISDHFIFKYDETVIQNDKNFIVPSDTSIIINYPRNHVTIVPPNGTDIIDYSNSTINLVLESFEIKTINMSKSISIFTPVNFIAAVKGLNKFLFTISYDENFSIPDYKGYFSFYCINWGNGGITSGNGTIPAVTENLYDETGNYKIIINLTDINGIIYSYTWDVNFNLNTEQFVKLWAVENKEKVAFGSAGIIGFLTFLGVILTETGKYKLLSFLILSFPMITKFQKEDVLDHFVRGQIYGFIKAYPGVHYNQIMRELDIKNGTLSYHLYILEKTKLIKSRKENFRYRVFYPIEVRFPEDERYRLTELQLDIMKLINEKKSVNQKAIAKNLNEKHQTISYNIKVLQKAGLINVNKKGRKIYCYINKTKPDLLKI